MAATVPGRFMPSLPTIRLPIAAALALSLAVIGYVLFSQHVQHYEPCELCLRERLPWYAAIGVSILGLLAPGRWALWVLALLFIVSAGLGGHHAGVELHWWKGPTACTGGASGARSIEDLRAFLHAQQVVQCDAIAWTLFGLSMAAYNFIVSLVAGVGLIVLARRYGNAR